MPVSADLVTKMASIMDQVHMLPSAFAPYVRVCDELAEHVPHSILVQHNIPALLQQLLECMCADMTAADKAARLKSATAYMPVALQADMENKRLAAENERLQTLTQQLRAYNTHSPTSVLDTPGWPDPDIVGTQLFCDEVLPPYIPDYLEPVSILEPPL
jgi:hypothetical protein